MKPRTKLHFEVVELSSRLLEISKDQKQWAYKECLEHRGYATKSRVLCLDCGETFAPQLVKRKKAVCPHCNTKLDVKESRKTTDQQTNYFAIAEVFGEFQIIRNYELVANYKKGNPANYHLHEILQYWILPNGKVTMFGKNHSSSWCMDSWNGTMEIRQNPKYSYNSNKYDVYPRKYHPDSVFKSEYSKYGINHQLSGLTVLEAIRIIPENPKLETLLKSKQYSVLGYSIDNKWKINSFWPSVKICLRNKYQVKDASMWFDYLELLQYFKKDLSNAKFICPKNLKAEHDRLMKKKRKILDAQERERKRQQAIERQKQLEQAVIEYVERCSKFFDLEFVNGKLSISVLKSVEDFKEEGDELNHCVFTNEYYLKDNSLILSAKVDGKRAETIELYLSSMKIEQSRGQDNKPSPYNKQILALMKKSLPKIEAVIKQFEPEEELEQIKQSA